MFTVYNLMAINIMECTKIQYSRCNMFTIDKKILKYDWTV